MAKFCIYCGKPLQEGKPCTCPGAQAAQKAVAAPVSAPAAPQYAAAAQTVPPTQAPNPAQGVPQYAQNPAQGAPQYAQNPAQGAPQYAQNPVQGVPQYAQNPVQGAPQQAVQTKAPSDASRYFKHLWNSILDIYRRPTEMLPSFSASGDTKTALGLLIIQALSAALFLLTVTSRVSDAFFSAFGFLGGIMHNNMSLPLPGMFLLTLLFSAASTFVLAAIFLLLTRGILKQQIAYEPMLCAASAGRMTAAPFLLLGCLLVFVNLHVAVWVVLVGIILSVLFTLEAWSGTVVAVQDKSKKLYTFFFGMALMTIVSTIFSSIVFSILVALSISSSLG